MPKVLELFSGIGGMRHALCMAGVTADFTPVDINHSANEVYRHCFPGSSPSPKRRRLDMPAMDIGRLPVEFFAGYTLWTMSPPCQPFSRQGKQKGSLDNRSNALHHIYSDVLQGLAEADLPAAIVLENVKGFEQSCVYHELKAALLSRGFTVHGFLLTPRVLGFPNERLRFYLVARRSPFPRCIPQDEIQNQLPGSEEYAYVPITDFLLTDAPDDLTIPETTLRKRAAFCFDIVVPKETEVYRGRFYGRDMPVGLQSPFKPHSLCFTKAYGRYVDGTGSVLCTWTDFESTTEEGFPIVDKQDEGCMLPYVDRLRYFHPDEVARVMGFKQQGSTNPLTSLVPGHRCLPAPLVDLTALTDDDKDCRCVGLEFPSCLTRKQKWKLLGNSLNPAVVALVVKATGLDVLLGSD
ncbi:MAG: uncharacterized protein KVP18_003812 [Porospora cf. gigantea A]|uniref:uncharacterized protein n=2 Tax=Porospora cf. gigantea A TaxID=2853593 RepID=UPI003559F72A|nr:MAG: hypothetical protein KVP18_003812 [Porospora cf. gigantea A]